jgi:hypothetical protein
MRWIAVNRQRGLDRSGGRQTHRVWQVLGPWSPDEIMPSERYTEQKPPPVLAVLTWWMSSEGLAFTFQGEPMPVELSGMGLQGDFVARRQGWEWPSNVGPIDT